MMGLPIVKYIAEKDEQETSEKSTKWKTETHAPKGGEEVKKVIKMIQDFLTEYIHRLDNEELKDIHLTISHVEIHLKPYLEDGEL